MNEKNEAGEGIQHQTTESIETMAKRLRNVENKLARPHLPAEKRVIMEQRRANLIKHIGTQSQRFAIETKPANDSVEIMAKRLQNVENKLAQYEIEPAVVDKIKMVMKRLRNVENKLERPQLPVEKRAFLEQRRANLIKRLDGKFTNAFYDKPKQQLDLDRTITDIDCTGHLEYVIVDALGKNCSNDGQNYDTNGHQL